VLGDGFHEELDALYVQRRQPSTQTTGCLGVDTPGTPIDHPPLVVKRAEVPSGRDVALPQLETDPLGRQDSSPDPIETGIVAEQRKVAGTAPWRNADADRFVQAAYSFGSDPIEVRHGRLLKLCPATVRHRKAA
jgi:hypothetical protein